MVARLSAEERVQLEQQRESLRLELLLVETRLRSDEAMRLQQEGQRVDVRPRLRRDWRLWIGR